MTDLKSVCGRSCACWHRDRGSGGGCFHGMFCNDKVVMWFLVGIVLTRGRGVVPIIYFLSSIDHYHFFTAAFPTPPNSHRRRESHCEIEENLPTGMELMAVFWWCLLVWFSSVYSKLRFYVHPGTCSCCSYFLQSIDTNFVFFLHFSDSWTLQSIDKNNAPIPFASNRTSFADRDFMVFRFGWFLLYGEFV